MTKKLGFLLLALLVVLTTEASAQDHQHGMEDAPYAGLEQRDIKALSEQEISGLRVGEGLGMALPAELNGYPGPRHVLDFADELKLDAETKARIQSIFDRMHIEAVDLGAQIIEKERALDEAFSSGQISEVSLMALIEGIGKLRSELRNAHLRAHLTTAAELSEMQRRHYAMLRGYGDHMH